MITKYKTYTFPSAQHAAEFIKEGDPPVRSWWTDTQIRVAAYSEGEEVKYDAVAMKHMAVFGDWEKVAR